MQNVGPMILGLISLVIMVIASRIRAGATWMLSGYRRERVTDERGLARWCGNGLLILALAGLVAAVAMALDPSSTKIVIALYLGTIALGVVTVAAGARRFLERV